ncbi:MAG: phasin family protein [Candidatus Competibacteraceae bacterium]|nr:phasin family protein [Candidatus Competibacteraceae bacterium]
MGTGLVSHDKKFAKYIEIKQKSRYAATHNFNAPCQFLREIIMSNEMLTKMSEQYQTFLSPVIKANKLSAANLEALVNFQMNSLQSYVDMAMARMKAAADISDPASLQTFLTSQAETISSLNQKFMDDTKALSDLMGRFKAEFDQLVKDSLPMGK